MSRPADPATVADVRHALRDLPADMPVYGWTDDDRAFRRQAGTLTRVTQVYRVRFDDGKELEYADDEYAATHHYLMHHTVVSVTDVVMI